MNANALLPSLTWYLARLPLCGLRIADSSGQVSVGLLLYVEMKWYVLLIHVVENDLHVGPFLITHKITWNGEEF